MPNTKNALTLEQPIVFYDGDCPLCKKEIGHYMGIDQNKSVHWVDISTDKILLTHYGISFASAMKKLHVIDINNQIRIGVDAFLTIWLRLPYYRYLAKTVTLLKLKKPMTWAYNIFAKQRYKKFIQRQRCTTLCKSLVK